MSEQRKVAVVTGAAQGIGKAIATKLAQDGANVVVSDINLELAQKTTAELQNLGVEAIAVKGDVSKSDDVAALMNTTVEKFGTIDYLVNNAGITRDNLAVRMSEAEWDMVININLKGVFLCSQQAAKIMMKKRSGSIVNIASVSGILGTAGQANYASSKAGVIALTKTLARELGPRNITVNAIAPGFIVTEMTDKLPDKVKEEYLKQIPLKRGGTPEDVANAVAFLVSPAASYITGTTIIVSGGMVI
ncbi:MAG TPA: 3-oxoacyl-[acyl-carrier-protein] reductase [Caldithrix abyssi]|uniref:3-oxoacyl-[acyl-carrier-protein] reductase n=1 Tax=Caldithrix abyssi TaxID=187145 RepID=A0A7V5PPT9_CALAY|nr:3-oxoacyl-[acyl-carrier-protein] reductase [Caldithrix abyssi]